MNGQTAAGKIRLSGTALKLIAVISMLTDHIAVVFIENGLLHAYDMQAAQALIGTDWGMRWLLIDGLLRAVGRLAFPIYVFLLVEGFLHTGNVKRYAGRLIFFALISEVPFDLAASNRLFDPQAQNIFVTLALGLLMMAALRQLGTRPVLRIGIVLNFAVVSWLLRSDYGLLGILTVAAFYLFRENKKYLYPAAGALLFWESLSVAGAAVLGLIPIRFYSGERGGGKGMTGRGKYLFYWFYPAHLLLLYMAAVWAGLL